MFVENHALYYSHNRSGKGTGQFAFLNFTIRYSCNWIRLSYSDLGMYRAGVNEGTIVFEACKLCKTFSPPLYRKAAVIMFVVDGRV